MIKSTNKNKTVWNIVKKLTNKRNNPHKITVMNINNNFSNNPETIANALNSFFSIAVNLNNKPQACNLPPNPLQYLTNNNQTCFKIDP